MRIFITGGTGFIGSHLVRNLSKKVDCLARTNDKEDAIRNLGGNPILGDLDNLPNLDKYDLIFHLAGILGGYAKDTTYYNTHVKGTANLIDKLSGQKLIVLSSAGVLGPVIDADEKFPLNPTNIYERTKAEAENIIKKYPNHVILRPEFVYGPGDKHVLKFFRSIKEGEFCILGDGTSMLHPTYVGDVINSLIASIKAQPGTFNLAGEKPISVNDFSRLISSHLNVKMPKKVPLWLARHYLTLTQVFGIKSKLTESRYKFFTESRTFNTDKAQNLLSYRPIQLEKGIEQTIEWYQQNGLL